MKRSFLFFITLIVSALVNIFFSVNGIFNVVPQLFYIPIALAILYYKKHGIYITVGISLLYLIIDTLISPDKSNIIPALVRSFVFLAIAMLLYVLRNKYNKAENELDVFFNINADMMCCTDQSGYFLKVNPAFSEVLGYSTDELIGRRFYDFIHPEDMEKTVSADNQLKKNNHISGFVNRYCCKDRTYRFIEWRSVPLNDLIYSSARDVTNRELEERMRINTILRYESLQNISSYEAENEIDLLEYILQESIKVIKSQHGFIFSCNEELKKITMQVSTLHHLSGDYGDENFCKNNLLQQVIRERKPVFLNNAEIIEKHGFCLNSDLRISNMLLVPIVDGKIMDSVIAVFNKSTDYDETDGLQLLLFMKATHELLLRRRTERELLSKKTWFETTLLSIRDGLIATDKSGIIQTVNPEAVKLTLYTSNDIIGKNISEIYQFEKYDDHSKKTLKTGQEFINDIGEDLSFKSEDGIITDLNIRMSEIKSADQSVLGYLFILRDETQRKEKEQEIIYLTYHDKMTGLYNRRFFEEELKRLDVDRYYPLSIIIGDVNGLKLINDAFGHIAGDELLMAVAGVIKEACRKGDICARWGGDEYGIILPNTDYDTAENIIRRIKEACLKSYVNNINLSISLGCATKNKNAEKIMDVLKRADDFMYKSKLLESRSMKSNAVKTLLKILYEKSSIEERHSNQVSAVCMQIGQLMGLSQSQISDLELLGKIHDIGKVSVDESIINKKGRITPDEYEAIKRHAEAGYHIINTSPELSYLANDILCHHERWDGSGYPNRIKGMDIPLYSRILTVADAYEAMTNERPYRKNFSKSDAMKELERCAGTQFDPDIVSKFITA